MFIRNVLKIYANHETLSTHSQICVLLEKEKKAYDKLNEFISATKIRFFSYSL